MSPHVAAGDAGADLDENPAIGDFVLYGARSVKLGTAARVSGGDVGVAALATPGFGPQLVVGDLSYVDVAHDLLAPSVKLDVGALVGGVETSSLSNDGGRFLQQAPLPSPMPPVPLALPAALGASNVTVGRLQAERLAPNAYGTLTVNGTLLLEPGVFVFSSVVLGDGARVLALPGGVDVHIARTLATGVGARLSPLQPEDGWGAGWGTNPHGGHQVASALRLSVLGYDAGSSLAATVGGATSVDGLVFAPHGTLSLGAGVVATGAFAGFDVHVGDGASVTFDTGFSASAPEQQGSQVLQGYAGLSAPIVGPVPATTQVTLGFGLPGQNLSGLKALAHQVSDPQSPQYRQYLAPSTLAAAYGATLTDYDGVQTFLSANGLSVVATYPNNLYVEATGSASAFGGVLYGNLVYRQRADGSQFVSIDREPSVSLTTPLLHVSGLENVMAPQATGPGGSGVPASDGSCLNSAYPCSSLFFGGDFPTAYARTARAGVTCTGSNSSLDGTGQRIGIYWTESYAIQDLQGFATGMGIDLTPGGISLVTNVGPDPGPQSRFETTMDIEAALAMAPGLSGVYVFGGNTVAGVFGAMATTTPLANQISMSLVEDVDVNAQAELAVLAAQGQSYFVGSGDWGATAFDANDIRVVDYVTVVGGTLLTMSSPGLSYDLENGWPQSGGGYPGGFGGLALPAYQQGMAWTQIGGSSSLRNVPDVAMPAENFAMFSGYGNATFPNGYWGDGSGTSLASPLFAGYMALVNQNSATTVGFANPLLYSIAQSPAYGASFNDIADDTMNPSTLGYTASGGGTLSFTAIPGYDLVTGWGSPTCNLIGELDSYACAPGSSFEYPCTMGGSATCQIGTHLCNAQGNFNGNACTCPTVEWANSYGQQGDLSYGSVAIDPSGVVLLGGSYNNTNGPIPGLPTLPSSGPSGAGILVWLDTSGHVTQATALTGSGTVSVAGVAADGNGNFYAAGASSGTVIAGTTPTTITAPSGGGTEGYVVEFTPSLTLGWSLTVANGAGGNVIPSGIAAAGGLVALGGSYTGSLTAGGNTVQGACSTVGERCGFVAALTPQGAISWVDDLYAAAPAAGISSTVFTGVGGVGVDALQTIYAYGNTNSPNAFSIHDASVGGSVQNILTNFSGGTVGGTYFARFGNAGSVLSFTPLGDDCESVTSMAADSTQPGSVLYLACGVYVPGGGGWHGGFAQTVTQYTGASNVFTETWSQTAAEQSPTVPGISALTTTEDGSVAAAFQYIAGFTFPNSTVSLPAVPSGDPYLLGVAKFRQTDGAPVWARAYDGNGTIVALAGGINGANSVVAAAGSITANATLGWTFADPQSQTLAVAAELVDP